MSDALFRTAGEAAELLEEMGYVAVARRRDGVITLELRQLVGRKEYVVRREVDDEDVSPMGLARVCDAEFRAAVPR